VGQLALLGAALPGLLGRPEQRALLREMRRFVSALPERLDGPLPESMAALTNDVKPKPPERRTETSLCNLADLAVVLERSSPLGLCLRCSMTRFYFLRREGLPLKIHYGTRMIGGEPDRQFNGHAWLTLEGAPYHEAGENWRGFTIMLTFPDKDDNIGS
jgi:hypothetical protein